MSSIVRELLAEKQKRGAAIQRYFGLDRRMAPSEKGVHTLTALYNMLHKQWKAINPRGEYLVKRGAYDIMEECSMVSYVQSRY